MKRYLKPLVVIGTMLVAGCVALVDDHDDEIASSELSATISSGAKTTIVGVGSSRCLGVKGNSAANGALVQMQGCSGSTFQQWVPTKDSAGFFQLKNVGSGQCLDVPGNAKTASLNIQQWGCAGSSNQKWNITDQGGGSFAIISQGTGLALDVAAASTANGARVVQFAFKGANNQKWKLSGATSTTATPTGASSGVTGFASTASDGLNTTTGGGSAKPIVVTSCEALKSALEDNTARVVQIPTGMTLDCRTANRTVQACQSACGRFDPQPGKLSWRIPVGDQTCADLGGGTLVNRTVNQISIRINSNKSLIGAGSGAVIKGASFTISEKSNVIIRNVTISEINPSIIEAGDGLTIEKSHHVWIDHNRFSNISDGYFDIKSSKAVTISFNHIVGTNVFTCGNKHNFISLVDASEVTFDHNFFDNAGGRNPKIGGVSKVHAFNNYYKNISFFCLGTNTGTEALVEANHYENSRAPHGVEGTGKIEANSNVYIGTSAAAGQARVDNADVFNPPYRYSLDNPETLSSTIPNRAGPRSL